MLPDRCVLPWTCGAIVAPVVVVACVINAGPSTKTVPDTAQDMRAAVSLPIRVPTRSVDGGKVDVAVAVSGGEKGDAEVSADPPGEPLRGVEEGLAPKIHPGSFMRSIDRAQIEARGAPGTKALYTATLRSAVAFDNEAWTGDPRRELLAYLRGDLAERGARFTSADARIVVRIQAGSGAPADGEVKDETIAVLFAMGFRFSPRKAPAREVKLDFYPGELEDLALWNREIDEKVTTKDGGFRDVDAPAGEGRIYVYVGRSIVASYRARGGPPSPLKDNGQHVAAPTTPGTYRLGAGHAHVTSNWYYSQIPWGAEIRKNGSGYEYRWPGRSDWSWATSNPAGKLKLPLAISEFEGLPEVTREDGATFLMWDKNDFGPIAWNLVPSDMYVHTTPEAEPDVPGPETSLPVSHGCIHIAPRDRDEMMKRGYLGANVLFVVRRWDEHLLPDQIRQQMLGRGPP
jgi:hypothetical protein